MNETKGHYVNSEDVPMPGHLMDGLFNARVLAIIETAIDMAEQVYPPSEHPGYDWAMRNDILEASAALQALKSRALEETVGRAKCSAGPTGRGPAAASGAP